MIKYFCDVCNKEIVKDFAEDRLKRELGHVQVEVMVAINKVWNKGEICVDCVMDTLHNGVDIT